MQKITRATLLGALFALVLSACTQTKPVSYVAPTTSPTPQATATPVLAKPVSVVMKAQRNSGLSGTATLEDLGSGKTKVTIMLSGKTTTTPEPAHIHIGSCAKPGDVVYPLTNVVSGKSETILDATLSTITAKGTLINVHKSAQEASVYVACGEWTPVASPTPGPTATPTVY